MIWHKIFINYDIAAAAIDSGSLIEAPALAEKVAAKSQRAMLFVSIAAKSVKRSDKFGALDLLNRAQVAAMFDFLCRHTTESM